MAKGKATGLWKGKVGNNVFYKITNSNNAQKQGIRERVIEVSNPKTTAQAGQRYKLLPAQRIASALKEIVERGQQGVKYGALSRNQFLSRALSMKTGFPYMEKSDPNVIPGEYQLTKGTLPEVKLTLVDGAFRTTLGASFGDGVNNLGEFSTALINGNPWLQNGDQFTIVAFVDSAGIIVPSYKSLILDTESTESEEFSAFYDGAWILSDADGYLNISETIAAAVVISRANGANGYLRSNATLAVDKTNAAIAKYFTPAGNDAALKTYEGDTSISNNTKWPVDIDGDGGASGGGGGSSVERGLYTLTAADCEAGSNGPVGSKILVGTVNSVIKNIYYVMNDEARCCCDLAGNIVEYSTGEDTLAITLEKLSETFLTGKNPVAY